MSIEKAISLIEKHKSDGDFSGPVSPDRISDAELSLGVSFPPSYKEFLERYGTGDIFGIEIYGITRNSGSSIPNAIWLTREVRESVGMPHDFVVIASSGFGPYIVLDTAVRNETNESPVLLWDTGNRTEKIAENFGAFLFDEITGMIDNDASE